MINFIKLEPYEEGRKYTLYNGGYRVPPSDGTTYLARDHIVHLAIKEELISICMAGTGCETGSDLFEIYFSSEGVGEYHRIKREILGE